MTPNKCPFIRNGFDATKNRISKNRFNLDSFTFAHPIGSDLFTFAVQRLSS